MALNAISTAVSTPSQDFLAHQSTAETNREKPSSAQEKAPSAPSSEDVVISSTGAELSARAEASEESNTENDSEKSREANKTAEAVRVQNNQASKEELSAEKQISRLNDAVKKGPIAAYSAQVNASENIVGALILENA